MEMAEGLKSGINIRDLTYIDGTVYKTSHPEEVYDSLTLPSFEEIRNSREALRKKLLYPVLQHGRGDGQTADRTPIPTNAMWCRTRLRSLCPPAKWIMCILCRICAPGIRPNAEAGGVPAIEEVRFSLVSNRGCFGGCSFCALTFHQGRVIQTRSHESILQEASRMVWEPDFKGYIHDVGGPTANFRHPSCEKQLTEGRMHQPSVPVSGAVSEPDGRPFGLSGASAEAARPAEREKGLYPFRDPF